MEFIVCYLPFLSAAAGMKYDVGEGHSKMFVSNYSKICCRQILFRSNYFYIFFKKCTNKTENIVKLAA